MSREMKDSGVEWIGEIPEDWKITKIKHKFKIVAGATPKSEQKENFDGNIIWITPADYKTTDKYVFAGKRNLSNIGYESCNTTIVPAGSIIFSKRAPIGSVAIARTELCTNQGCLSCVKKEDVAEIYFYFLMSILTEEFELLGTGTTFKEISAFSFANFRMPCPSIDEQVRIATFLEKKCGKIDNIIQNSKISIGEYKKLKDAIISRAVTNGIRTNRIFCKSGIKWIQELPEGWKEINPKALFIQRKDKAYEGERQLTASQQYGVIFQEDYMKIAGSKIVTVEKDFSILKHVEKGDFVISMRSFQGGLEYSENTGSISSAYVMLVPNLEKVYPRFYRWLFKSSVYINALQSTSNLVRDGQAMRYSNFAQVRLYDIPIEEQKEIAHYLDEKCKAIDVLIDKKQKFVNELKKYKESMIYEYVTGKRRCQNLEYRCYYREAF